MEIKSINSVNNYKSQNQNFGILEARTAKLFRNVAKNIDNPVESKKLLEVIDRLEKIFLHYIVDIIEDSIFIREIISNKIVGQVPLIQFIGKSLSDTEKGLRRKENTAKAILPSIKKSLESASSKHSCSLQNSIDYLSSRIAYEGGNTDESIKLFSNIVSRKGYPVLFSSLDGAFWVSSLYSKNPKLKEIRIKDGESVLSLFGRIAKAQDSFDNSKGFNKFKSQAAQLISATFEFIANKLGL